MIIGIGIDIVDMRVLDRNVKHITGSFTQDEIKLAESRPQHYIQTIGKRWAVKEAVLKALGDNSTLGGINMKDIEVKLWPNGKPFVTLSGGAEAQLQNITPIGKVPKVDVSITDDGLMAVAVAIIHAEPSA